MRFLRGLITVIQIILALRVLQRLIATMGGTTIKRIDGVSGSLQRATILVPVLNEEQRILACLERLAAQGDSVQEILVIDGGSTDRTREIVTTVANRDARIRLLTYSGDSGSRNQKALQLHQGLLEANPANAWILTIDADVRIEDGLVEALMEHARNNQLDALSVATAQRLSGPGVALVHPSMLTTLVYRFGIPGHRLRTVDQVQANGQCMLLARSALNEVGGFESIADSVCEDVTLARSMVALGLRVGFHETDNLVATEMYGGFDDALDNWSRSLPMRDRFSGTNWIVGLAEVLFVQALPFWRVISDRLAGRTGIGYRLNRVLLMVRLGVLAGTSRAYPARPWTYWLSPLMDMPVALRLARMSLRSTHTWRGRTISTGRQQ